MQISVVICTRNRQDLLIQVLQSLCQQTVPVSNYEVLVVDNASTDGTPGVVECFFIQLPYLRYIFVPRLGLSMARNRGWQEAHGEYIAYIDDDSKAPAQWLEIALDVIHRENPDMFGGPVYPFYSAPKPAWYKDEYNIAANGDRPKQLVENEYFHGSNMFIRGDVFDLIGGFDETLGMAGSQLGYAEETDFLNRFRMQKPAPSIYYEPRLLSYHLVRPEKYSLAWQFRSRFPLGRQNYLANSGGVHTLTFKHILAFFLMPFLMIYQATLGVLLRNRSVYPYPQNYYVECLFHSLSTWSRHYQRLLSYFGKKVSK
jgi:glycosyltransferase involved in cell wall biosynthesis